MKTQILLPTQALLVHEDDTSEFLEILSRCQLMELDYSGRANPKEGSIKIELLKFESAPLPAPEAEAQQEPTIPF